MTRSLHILLSDPHSGVTTSRPDLQTLVGLAAPALADRCMAALAGRRFAGVKSPTAMSCNVLIAGPADGVAHWRRRRLAA